MKQNFHIIGMHCVSCEVLLKNNLKKIPELSVDSLSFKSGILKVTMQDQAQESEVLKAIHASGFTTKEESQNQAPKTRNTERILQNIIILLCVLVVLMFSRVFDLGGSMIPSMDKLQFGSAFLIGIVASLSTCLAVTGGIIIGYARYLDTSHGLWGHAKVGLAFQAGRLGAFFLGGAILGLGGSVLGISVNYSASISIIIGALILYIGLQTLGIVPNISRLGVAFPSSFADKVQALGHPKYAPLAGAATFFLPCGFTQTMQILALSSGSFLLGGGIMLVFALGTFPVLFGLGLGVSSISEKKSALFSKVIAATLIFFGLTTLLNAKNLIVLPLTPQAQEVGTISQNIEDLEYETIEMSHDGWSTIPSTLTLEAGKNYKVIITPESNGLGCMSTQYIPKIRSEVSYVQAGVPIEYDFITPLVGKYDIVCASMGMKQGTIIFK